MVDSVRPLLELARVLASACFVRSVLPGWIRKGFVGLQLALMTHGRGAADDEDHDDEKRGHDNNDEQILLQEIHYSGQDKVFQTDHGGGDGVGEVGSASRSGDGNRCSSGGRYWKKEFQFCFITTAVHGHVVEQRSSMTHTTPQREQGHTGDERNQTGLHLLFSCNNNDVLKFRIKRGDIFKNNLVWNREHSDLRPLEGTVRHFGRKPPPLIFLQKVRQEDRYPSYVYKARARMLALALSLAKD